MICFAFIIFAITLEIELNFVALTGNITASYRNNYAGSQRSAKNCDNAAERITGVALPILQDIYIKQFRDKARKIIKVSSHPHHSLFSLATTIAA